jgi:cysteine desulfuration protein SufE
VGGTQSQPDLVGGSKGRDQLRSGIRKRTFSTATMADFPPTVDELLETFEDLDQWDERYDFIIDLGRELPALPDAVQSDDNIVEGCMSTVWMATEVAGADQPVEIYADSDSLIVKGLIAVLLAFYDGKTAQQIIDSDVSEYLTSLGLNQHLSPQRRNGLFSMIKRLNALAQQHSVS